MRRKRRRSCRARETLYAAGRPAERFAPSVREPPSSLEFSAFRFKTVDQSNGAFPSWKPVAAEEDMIPSLVARQLTAVALLSSSFGFGAANAQPARSAGQSATSIRIPFEQLTLPNGLHVILAPDSTKAHVFVEVWYHVGSRNEAFGQS